MQRTKIEWTDYVWNPIKGVCPVGCWYCYARKMYQRFKWDSKVRYEIDDLRIIHDLKGKEYSKIFVCSTFELFHPITNTLLFPLTEGSDITYRDMVFKIIEDNPQHTFQILTKFPQNIDREMPSNVWLGVTVESPDDMGRSYDLIGSTTWRNGIIREDIKAKIKFISFEPLLGFMDKGELDHIQCFDWIIVGRLTQHGRDHDPPRWWIEEIINVTKKYKIPLFMKDNLREIWGEPLIQEMPKEA